MQAAVKFIEALDCLTINANDPNIG